MFYYITIPKLVLHYYQPSSNGYKWLHKIDCFSYSSSANIGRCEPYPSKYHSILDAMATERLQKTVYQPWLRRNDPIQYSLGVFFVVDRPFLFEPTRGDRPFTACSHNSRAVSDLFWPPPDFLLPAAGMMPGQSEHHSRSYNPITTLLSSKICLFEFKN